MKAWIVSSFPLVRARAGLNWLMPGTVLDGFAFAIPARVLSAVYVAISGTLSGLACWR